MLQRNINDIIGANRQKGLKYHMEQRIDKVNYYLNIAKAVAERSTCFCLLYTSTDIVGAILISIALLKAFNIYIKSINK